MRIGTLAVLALLALPGIVQGEPAPQDLDGASAYAAAGAGALAGTAGAPAWGPDLAPSLGQAATSPALSYAQGRALRPAGLAMAWWLGDASASGDAHQGAAEQDSLAFLAAWAAWARVASPFPALPEPPRALLGAQRLFQGDIDVATSPPLDEVSDAEELRVAARIASATPGGRIREAWAFLQGPEGLSSAQLAGDVEAWTGAFVGLVPGEHALWIEAVEDALGAPAAAPALAQGAWFVGVGRSQPVGFEVRDALAPFLAVEGPVLTNLDTVTLLIRAADASGVEALRIQAGDGPAEWQPAAPRATLPLDRDGAITITVQARDPAGNVAAAVLQVLRDTDAPRAILGAPDETWQRGPVKVGAWPGESFTPALAALTTDGSDPRGATFREAAAVDLAAPGVHELRAVARDAAGNIGPETTRTVRLDPLPPEITLVEEPAALVAPARIALRATDAHSGVASLVAELRDAHGRTSMVDPAGFDVPAGRWTLRASATDAAGNVATLERLFEVAAPIALAPAVAQAPAPVPPAEVATPSPAEVSAPPAPPSEPAPAPRVDRQRAPSMPEPRAPPEPAPALEPQVPAALSAPQPPPPARGLLGVPGAALPLVVAALAGAAWLARRRA